MSGAVERDARRALGRLRRAVEKCLREIESLEGAIGRAEGSDFPEEEYRRVRARLEEVETFTEEEGRRLQQKILEAGGLEPGRVRRSSSR